MAKIKNPLEIIKKQLAIGGALKKGQWKSYKVRFKRWKGSGKGNILWKGTDWYTLKADKIAYIHRQPSQQFKKNLKRRLKKYIESKKLDDLVERNINIDVNQHEITPYIARTHHLIVVKPNNLFGFGEIMNIQSLLNSNIHTYLASTLGRQKLASLGKFLPPSYKIQNTNIHRLALGLDMVGVEGKMRSLRT